MQRSVLHREFETHYVGNCIGDCKSQRAVLLIMHCPNLFRLFNLQTILAKAVYDVILIISVILIWAVTIHIHIYLKGMDPPSSLSNLLSLKSFIIYCSSISNFEPFAALSYGNVRLKFIRFWLELTGTVKLRFSICLTG